MRLGSVSKACTRTNSVDASYATRNSVRWLGWPPSWGSRCTKASAGRALCHTSSLSSPFTRTELFGVIATASTCAGESTTVANATAASNNMVSYAMSFSTLVSTGVLASHIDDPVIVDCRSKLDDEDWGKREYGASHIPGAVYADLNRDLSGPKTGTNGRHPLPNPLALAQTFSRLGITSGVQVVAYDQDNAM